MNDIGERLKKLRNKRGYSLRRLGEKLNIAYTHLSRIENGHKKPNIELIHSLSDFFDVPASYFFEDLTEGEQELITDLDLSDDELIEKYNLVVDGKEVSEQEIKMMLSVVRSLRATEKES